MAGGARSIDPAAPAGRAASRAWWLLAAGLAVGSVALAWTDPAPWDWQPGLAWAQPWRWWSAAWVHWSTGHLAANLLGTLLVAALGWRAQCDRIDTAAWFVAWPLTHLGLTWQPGLLHYGGLSGVLHAGVVIAALALVERGLGVRRWVGAAIASGVVLKVLSEHPWDGPLRHAAGWDIAIAPAAHLSGVLSGVLCATVAAAWQWRTRRALAVHP